MKFTPIILVIAAILLFFFYIDPEYQSIKERLTYQDGLKESLEQAQDLSELRRKKVAEYDAFKEADKRKLAVMISSQVDETSLFNNIAGIGSQNGVSLTKVSIGEDVDGGGRGEEEEEGVAINDIKDVNVSFTAQTSYTNFVAFLEDIEKSLQIMDVKSFKVSPTATGARVYDFEVQLTAYSL